MKKVLSAVSVGAVALLALAGCSAAAEENPAPSATAAAPEITDLASLVEAAKAEGALTVYGQLPEDSMTAYATAFEEEYGIKVETLRLGGNTLAARFEAEAAAGTHAADAVISVDVEFVKKATADKLLVGFKESGVGELVENFPADGIFEPYDAPHLQVLDIGFNYNVNKVQAADIPTEWADLNSDRWKGKYCAVDAESSLNVGHFFWKLFETEGEQAVKDFGANIGRWYPNVVAMNEAVAVGECELGIGSAKFFVDAAKASGAPVEFAAQPLSIRPLTTVVASANAKHPAAAKLFLTFVLSEENNSLLNDPAIGSFGVWDRAEMPADFAVPSPEEFASVHEELPAVIALLG